MLPLHKTEGLLPLVQDAASTKQAELQPQNMQYEMKKKNGSQNPPPNLQLKKKTGFFRLPTAQQRAAVEPPPTQPKWMLG